jgi:hypothetical protein
MHPCEYDFGSIVLYVVDAEIFECDRPATVKERGKWLCEHHYVIMHMENPPYVEERQRRLREGRQ